MGKETIIIEGKEFFAIQTLKDLVTVCDRQKSILYDVFVEPVVEDFYYIAKNEKDESVYSICETILSQYIYYSNDGYIIAHKMPCSMKKFVGEMKDRIDEKEFE